MVERDVQVGDKTIKRVADTDVKIVVKDGKIVEVTRTERGPDGNVKGEEYGKAAGPEGYKTAHHAQSEAKKYPELLIEKHNIDEVDTLSGATLSHAAFVGAVKEALKDAKN